MNWNRNLANRFLYILISIRRGKNPDSFRLQVEESALKMQYRKLMAKDNREEESLYQVFRKLIEIRCELADSLGYNSYIDLGYHIEERQEYGTREIADFCRHIQKYITPVVAEIKAKEFDFSLSCDNRCKLSGTAFYSMIPHNAG